MGSMPMPQEAVDLLLTAEEVALKLKVSKDWVWDHSSRRRPYLPVIRMSDGALRYRASGIEQSKLNVAQVILGLKSEMSKFEAREKLEREIARLGGQSTGDQSVVNGSVTSEWFVNNRYLPLKEADWREETAKVKKYLIQADLVDTFGDARHENIDKFALQTHLNRLAQTRSRDRVLQVRAYLQAIFAEAVDQDFIGKDTACTIKVPAHL